VIWNARQRPSLRTSARAPHAEAPAAADGASTQIQHTIYFDTPGLALRKAGFTLRVREADDGFVQTVKWAGNRTLHRQECEWPVTLRRLTKELTLDRLDLAPALGVVGNRSKAQLARAVERRASRWRRWSGKSRSGDAAAVARRRAAADAAARHPL
jgi:inorganic triphosphatase YgiF